jgi:o-succinylbenzoate---CoA ligase
MLFVSKEGELINTEPGNAYLEKCISIIKNWETDNSEFEIETSGSTGNPKKISITNQMIEASINQTIEAFNLSSEDLFFCCLNTDYIAGKMMIYRALYLNADLIIVEPSANPFEKLGNQEYFLKNSRNKVFMAFVPLQLESILRAGSHYLELLNLAKNIIIGGAACSESLIAEIETLSAPVYSTYGMTETVTHIAIRKLNGEDKSKNFKALNGVTIKQKPNKTLALKSKVTMNQWLETNDLINLISENEFELIGRLDNTINSGGVKIQLELLEKKIEKYIPTTYRYFLFGKPDTQLGQKLCLAIETTEPITLINELETIFKKNLTKFEVPKEIHLISRFQETPTSKIDKNKTVDGLS